MKTTTKFAIGAAAVIAVSAGVAGVTAYAVMQKNTSANASFYQAFRCGDAAAHGCAGCFEHAAC